ncbi:hypothetical protein AWC38_SpisGene2557 [Stylophora pistillata]|uniref:Uncharacterized protein n=1 Tax=Stylophora pistillata TaxID=50429 RepID=A0A2B4SRU9_STYPI|nr:hypothetical protein AWC38_SpisGene2557 [Stylophora pistillata]
MTHFRLGLPLKGDENKVTSTRKSHEMEFCKSFFSAIFMVTAMSSVTWTAPLSYRPSDTEIVVRLSLMPTRANTTKEMLKVYQFIASNWDLKETPLALGVADTPVCSSSLQKKDNLSIAFMQLHNFIHPLYLAYSIEEVKGSQHKVLASALRDTSFHLNNTVWRVRRAIKKAGSSIPTVQHISEASLDHHTRTYLQAMVNSKRVTLTITDDVVKTYRNYVILYTLKDVLIDALTCV